MYQLCDEARKLSKIKENSINNSVLLVFEGFNLVEVPKSHFKTAKDFRDYPRIMEEVLSSGGGWLYRLKINSGERNK